ncbi:hypothetical protein HDU86_001977 [Geranomyces michiganensis]|nr:hypothetical protein HDU86_001977 [Geranomyces michiganensis]
MAQQPMHASPHLVPPVPQHAQPPAQSSVEDINKTLAAYPPEQMLEVLAQMKVHIQSNPNDVRAMLAEQPQLSYALFQALLVMNVVDPAIMQNQVGAQQMPNTAGAMMPPTFMQGGIPPHMAQQQQQQLPQFQRQQSPHQSTPPVTVPVANQQMSKLTVSPAKAMKAAQRVLKDVATNCFSTVTPEMLQEQQKQLLLQVLNMTPEQIQLLPPDQREKILQLVSGSLTPKFSECAHQELGTALSRDMHPVSLLLGAGFTGSAAIGCELIAARSGRRPALFRLLKPATTILIALSLFAHPDPPTNLLVAAYVFALIGDIALMFEGDAAFLMGLGSFFIAHVAFVAVFAGGDIANLTPPAWTAGMIIYAAGFFAWLLPHTGDLKVPVVAYGAVLTVMTLAAAAADSQLGTASARLALVGALFFVLSDSALAVRRFRGLYTLAEPLILSTYWTAIGLIAISRWPQGLEHFGVAGKGRVEL